MNVIGVLIYHIGGYAGDVGVIVLFAGGDNPCLSQPRAFFIGLLGKIAREYVISLAVYMKV